MIPPPCENCITFPICKSQFLSNMENPLQLDLTYLVCQIYNSCISKKCCLMNNYISNYVTNEAYTDYHIAHKALILIEAFNLWGDVYGKDKKEEKGCEGEATAM